MARQIYLVFLVVLTLFTTSCLSLLVPEERSDGSEYLRAKTEFEKKIASNEAVAKKIYETDPSDAGFEKMISQCRVPTEDLFYQNQCYLSVFPINLSKSMCESLGKKESFILAHYECYRALLKRLKITEAEVNRFCIETMCFVAYLSLDPQNNQTFPSKNLTEIKMRYMMVFNRAENSTELVRLKNDHSAAGFYFHEILYGGGRVDGSYTLGYDLNFGSQKFPFGFGLGMYDVRNDIKSFDLVISATTKEKVNVRLGVGTLVKENVPNRYHIFYSLGMFGVTPLIEASSDFNKNHQITVGVIYLYQIPRRSL